MYLVINKVNGNIEESNKNKYLNMVPANESSNALTKYGELWDKIINPTRSTSSNSNNYDKKYMKNKLNSDHGLTLRKTLELYNIIIVVRYCFHEDNKY